VDEHAAIFKEAEKRLFRRPQMIDLDRRID